MIIIVGMMYVWLQWWKKMFVIVPDVQWEEKEKRKKALKEYSSYDYDEESGPARSWSYEHEGLTVPWRGTEE